MRESRTHALVSVAEARRLGLKVEKGAYSRMVRKQKHVLVRVTPSQLKDLKTKTGKAREGRGARKGEVVLLPLRVQRQIKATHCRAFAELFPQGLAEPGEEVHGGQVGDIGSEHNPRDVQMHFERNVENEDIQVLEECEEHLTHVREAAARMQLFDYHRELDSLVEGRNNYLWASNQAYDVIEQNISIYQEGSEMYIQLQNYLNELNEITRGNQQFVDWVYMRWIEARTQWYSNCTIS
jgi:hypothetical protein